MLVLKLAMIRKRINANLITVIRCSFQQEYYLLKNVLQSIFGPSQIENDSIQLFDIFFVECCPLEY